MFVTSEVRRRTMLAAVAAGLLAGSVALAAGAGSAPQQLARQVTSSILEELTSRGEELRSDPRSVYELVDRLVLPHFDFERMSRRVLGKRWKQASPEQRRRFVSVFRSMLVRTYATVLNEYRGQTLTWLDPAPRKKDGEIAIPVDVELDGSRTVRVVYAMHGDGTEWKVFDVTVEGVSIVTNYRASFRAEIARHGIEGLIASLEARTAKKD